MTKFLRILAIVNTLRANRYHAALRAGIEQVEGQRLSREIMMNIGDHFDLIAERVAQIVTQLTRFHSVTFPQVTTNRSARSYRVNEWRGPDLNLSLAYRADLGFALLHLASIASLQLDRVRTLCQKMLRNVTPPVTSSLALEGDEMKQVVDDALGAVWETRNAS